MKLSSIFLTVFALATTGLAGKTCTPSFDYCSDALIKDKGFTEDDLKDVLKGILEMLATPNSARADAQTQGRRVVIRAQPKSCWSREDTSCTIIFGSKTSAINGFEIIHNKKMIQFRILQHTYSLLAIATA
ncbi:hypothetical protein ACN38_g2353 [Penicillium nordicum]|uniref:Uncharacterized protein n=1 Tax=Penicillium nordicum TaxID=229535 RepID=A0A0M8P766_9EURO|nr:hypothetical protein ACN38_g2353 [Penicillium nordicum]